MTPRSLQAVLRSLADAGPPASDAELLRRFLADDEDAFAELVKRHGRLVWAVCRTQTHSDAEADDAFQATFLVLLKNAKKVRDGGKLSSWLHGVAFKVCAKARQGAKRRTTREQATAHREGNGSAVPDSAWDRALAAVHEEAAKLPDTLRVPFVLCCLEGKGVTEAAEQLGWKLGTLSGRLTRAKDAVLAKLDARGLTLGVVAAVGLVVPPAAAVAKAAALAQVGFAVPGSILQLSQGVIGMSMTSVKVLAATVLLACGLGLSVGTGWVASADAQQPAQTKPKADPDGEVKRLQAELDKAKALAELAAKQAKDAQLDALRLLNRYNLAELLNKDVADKAKPGAKPAAENEATIKTAKWEYALVDDKHVAYAVGEFAKVLQTMEDAGWEFLGSSTGGPSGTKFQWLFRRPVKAVSGATTYSHYPKPGTVERSKPATFTWAGQPIASALAKPDDAKAIEAEIAKLTKKLAELKAKEPPATNKLTIQKDELPVPAAELVELLRRLAGKKFGKGASINVVGDAIVIEGDDKLRTWVWELVMTLSGK